jgi:phosphatidylglycerophosphatase A
MPSTESPSQERPRLTRPAILLATWFGAGYLPKIPGTWGSLAALPFAWLLHGGLGQWGLFAAALAVFAIGIPCANVYIRASGKDDPGPVVIDEVAGQWLTLVMAPMSVQFYVLGFVLFRIADIWKPWPVSWADRQIKGGFGVMFDDVLAAIYAGAVLYGLSLWMGS